MKLKDTFATKVASQVSSAPSKDEVRAAMHTDVAFEQLFDLIAQAGGPDMTAPSVPSVNPSDVADVSDQWPEQDITRQIQDLRTQGLDDGAIFKQLMEMQVLGTPQPFAQDMEYLDQVVRSAQTDDDDVAPDSSAPKPSEVRPGLPWSNRPKPELNKNINELNRGMNVVGPDLRKDLAPNIKRDTIVSFLKYVQGLHQKWLVVHDEFNKAMNPEPFGRGGPPATRADKQYLKREMSYIQEKISRAGNMYKKLVNIYGQEILQDEEIKWLQEQLASPGGMLSKDSSEEGYGSRLDDKDSLSSPGIDGTGKIGQRTRLTEDELKQMILDHGRNDAFKAKPPSTHALPNKPMPSPQEQSNRVQTFQEHMPPGKFGQVAPPAKPPAPSGPPQAVPPPPGAPPAAPSGVEEDMDMSNDMEVEDMRSLVEVMTDLEDDFSALKEKLESGETILHGQEVEPVEDDTGSLPAGPPKIAVDEAAKDYYSKYYKDYGKQLTDDRFASIVDAFDEVGQLYYNGENAHKFTTLDVNRVAKFVASRYQHIAEQDDELLTRISDKILINYLFDTGMVFQRPSPDTAPAVFKNALLDSVVPIEKYAEGKMKTPKPKGQPDDAVKLDKLKDKAEDGDSRFHPAHLPMEVVKSDNDSTYQYLDIEWDTGHESAKCRSDAGLAQAVVSFVKGLESQKEFKDLGLLGKIVLDELDVKAGTATVHFRTQKLQGPLRTTKE